ncbi:phosphoribosylglycinamide synthetase C domain-containing protein [Variovorax sp. J22P271]|uniref:phosphoribosylglycinamide synthetase C domain-containing protein n=1 Tax=Variovorax davisae TaxID=3053515 RepID=UPI002578E49C|nr:phosphoribosylglycinamide synthetase C domain-containing protein [Variovorax sp. J22P271]MDM0032141.1 phosphoribosylglycinamide synthetase C domain-containing protein [Variovorax sp. J22P271]
MRVLGVGETCDLGDMYWRLQRAGHEVRVFIEDPDSHDVFGGIVPRTSDWRAELTWIRAAGRDGLVVFESAAKGEWQDALRSEGYRVVGGSQYGDRLEANREFGQSALRAAGLRTARTREFKSFDAALDFLRAQPGRYVFKSNGAGAPRTRNYIGQLEDGADMRAFLALQRTQLSPGSCTDFVLMDHVEGVEVGVGAYFNGHRFLDPPLVDWEHKRFFPGDIGELTGEMGTIVSYEGAANIFRSTLACVADQLRAAGHCGYINLNLIANPEGLWPLEFTSRFGYPGFAICDALHDEDWASVLVKMVDAHATRIQTRTGFACGVVLTVPPFPYRYGYDELSKGLPITFRKTASAAHKDALHFGEIAKVGGQLVTSGQAGYVGVATGTGLNVNEARRAAYDAVQRLCIPNMRYREDIGLRLVGGDLERLRTWGYLS